LQLKVTARENPKFRNPKFFPELVMKGKTSKIFVIGAMVIAVTGGGLFFGLDALVRESKEAIRHELQKAVGRPVAFDTLELNVWGTPSLALNNVTVQDDPRFAATPFMQARQLKVGVRWLSLLAGKPEITGLVLEEPEIQLIRNEYGDVNIFKPSKHGAKREGLSPLRLPVTGIQANGGNLHFIDRSSDRPEELRLRDLSVSLHRSDGDKISINVKGALAEEDHKPFAVKGTVGPLEPDANWARNPLDLELQVTSVPHAIVSRSLALFEDRVPAYLRVSGPLEIKARVSGTIGQPRISKVKLKGALFGATAYNTTLTADVDFSKDSTWNGGLVKAQLDLKDVTLDQLKQIPWVNRLLPTELIIKGPVALRNTIDGKLGDFEVRTVLNARDNEIRYGKWFRKLPGVQAKTTLVTRLNSQQIVIDASTLQLYNGTFGFSGSITEKPEQVLQLRVKTADVSLVGWQNLIASIEAYEIDGKLNAEFSVRKRSTPHNEQPVVLGYLQLTDTHAISKQPGRRNFEGVNVDLRFQGNDIEIRNFQLRSGTSDVALKGQVTNLRQPVLYYSLQSTKLRLSDLTRRKDQRDDLLHHLASEGVMALAGGLTSVKGDFTSSDGRLKGAEYRNLSAKLDWTPRGLKFKDLSFEALGGQVKAYGSVLVDPALKFRVRVSPTIRDLDMKQFLALVSPGSADVMSGRMDLDGQFSGAGEDWPTLSQTLNGQGRMDLHDGVIANFNLVQGVLAALDAVQGIRGITSAGPKFTSLVRSGQTSFENIRATFGIEKGRVASDDLTMKTRNYIITSDGWLNADGRLDWRANLVLSPDFSRALSARHRNVRYLLDDQDVMSVPFHLNGKIPKIQAKPEVNQLARFMRAKVAEDRGRRKSSTEDADPGLWNGFRQSSDDLWNSFRQLFR